MRPGAQCLLTVRRCAPQDSCTLARDGVVVMVKCCLSLAPPFDGDGDGAGLGVS